MIVLAVPVGCWRLFSDCFWYFSDQFQVHIISESVLVTLLVASAGRSYHDCTTTASWLLTLVRKSVTFLASRWSFFDKYDFDVCLILAFSLIIWSRRDCTTGASLYQTRQACWSHCNLDMRIGRRQCCLYQTPFSVVINFQFHVHIVLIPLRSVVKIWFWHQLVSLLILPLPGASC